MVILLGLDCRPCRAADRELKNHRLGWAAAANAARGAGVAAEPREQDNDLMDLTLSVSPAARFLTLPTDLFIGKSIALYGEWSHGEIEQLAGLIQPTDNVLEAGANIGAHSVFIARDICPAGTLYAFEPRRILFQMLCANLMLNGVGNVEAYQLALGEGEGAIREGPFPLSVPVNAGAFSLGTIPGDAEEIRVVQLDALLDQLKPISLLKADIEGHELKLLRGAAQLIARDRPMLYLENDRTDLSEALITHVLGLGYDACWHIVPLFRPQNLAGATVNVFANIYSFNMLCVPRERGIDLGGHAITDPCQHPLQRKRLKAVIAK
jgi:FkbM family methyltransferase